MDISTLGLSIHSECIQPSLGKLEYRGTKEKKSGLSAEMRHAGNRLSAVYFTARKDDLFQTTTSLSSGGVKV